MTVQEIWNSRSWRFMFWLTAALLAYRTAPDAGFPLWLSVCTGIVYLAMWAALIHLDARQEEKVSALMRFMAILMVLTLITLVSTAVGWNLTMFAVFWLIPVGMPLQGLVRLVSDAASRADAPMAAVSLGLLAILLLVRVALHRKWEKNA